MSTAAEGQRARNLAAWPSGIARPAVALEPAVGVQVEEGSAWPVLTLRDGDRLVPVHGRRDPVRDAERELLALDIATASCLFVVGFGLGYIADALERLAWSGRLVAFEPSAAVAQACLARRDWTTWFTSGRLVLLTGPSYGGLDGLVGELDPNREAPVLIVNPVIARLQAAETTAAVRQAQRAWFGARANQEARRRMGGRYLLNTLRNAATIAAAADVDALTGRVPGVPAVLVAAGPSLDRNLADLVEARERALIVAVDTALRPLLSAGIEPDLVVAVDPGESNARHLVDLPPCPGTALVAEGSLDPSAMAGFAGRLFVFRVSHHHPWPWLEQQGIRRGQLRAWGSVLTTAFDLVLRMGCDPIVFTGADLAFTAGQPYARGTTYEEDWRRESAWGGSTHTSWQARVSEWPETLETGIAGRALRTAPHLVAFRDWILREAGRAEGRTVFNASTDGILVGPGIVQQPLSDCVLSRAPLPSTVRSVLRSDRRTVGRRTEANTAQAVSLAAVSSETERDWLAFAQVTPAAIAGALAQPAAVGTGGRVSGPVVEVSPSSPAAPETGPEVSHPDLAAADARYVHDLAHTHALIEIVLRSPEADLVDVIRKATSTMTRQQAVVVIDAVGHGVGAQVRRSLDVILCERPDLWLDYRRFADPSSRLSILRADAEVRAPAPGEVDALKWLPAHAAAADTLTPILVDHLRPRSVIDLACGAGFWLRAFEHHGATTVRGITFRAPVGACHPAVEQAAPEALSTGLEYLRASEQRYDLCLALELFYQLPPSAHRPLVDTCAALSDQVVFSSRLPGSPEMSGWARPLPYWAALFWDAGYLLDEDFRGLVEERWQYPRTIFDTQILFRRALSDRDRADASARARYLRVMARLHHLYEQNIWWAQRGYALAHQLAAVIPPTPIHLPRTDWTVPEWRLLGEPGAIRCFTFRTDAARSYLTDPRAVVVVCEDGRPLRRVTDQQALEAAPAGGWWWVRDQLAVRSSDGTDPRTNGRRYSIDLPGFVAWAESQPLAAVLHDNL